MIEELQRELEKTLLKAESQRKMLRITKTICYGVTLLYFMFILYIQLFGLQNGLFIHDYEANPNPSFWEANPIVKFILPIFIMIYISGAMFPWYFSRFTKLEQDSVQKIMSRLFPQVKCMLGNVSISKPLLVKSNLFPELSSRESSAAAFGSIELPGKGCDLMVYDLAITGTKRNFLTSNALADYLRLFLLVFKLTVSSRVESGMCAFRGMYASARLPKAINGTVIILPDKLTERLDYLAPVIQSMKKVKGSTLVKLEDPEFERNFSVYATDEVLARYVLTPLMMQQMTSLHRKYNRDIMLSFHADMFSFAVPMPEGLLTLGDKSIANGNSIQVLHDNVLAAQSILKDLRLES